MYIQRFSDLEIPTTTINYFNLISNYKIPLLKNGENKNFAFASSAIEIQ